MTEKIISIKQFIINKVQIYHLMCILAIKVIDNQV